MRVPVIHVTWCYHKVEQFSLLIAYQVKLESKEPAHGTFAPLCDALECLVHMDPLILAYTQRGTVHKADACTLAQENLLDEHYQWDGNLTFQFNETVVGYRFWKQMAHVLAYLFEIEMLQAAIP